MPRSACCLHTCALMICASLLVHQRAAAFNSAEHEQMGNRALRIALDINGINCDQFKEPDTSAYAAACSLLPKKTLKSSSTAPTQEPDRESTYGFIDREVDFMLSPEEILVHVGDDIGYPHNVSELNPSLIGRYAKRETEYLRSSHNNEAHFQGYALFNQFDWHRRAREIASERQNLYAALIANAISDHYLQDSFAPGHMVTPRYNFEDEFALGMHDKYNKVGDDFEIEHWAELLPILEFIKKATVVEDANQVNAYGFPASAITQLERNHQRIRLQGDGYLTSNPNEELLITLIEVVSITEVIQCFQSVEECHNDLQNRFSSYTWHTTTVALGAQPTPPASGIYFGKQSVSSFRLFEPVIGVSIGEDTVFLGTGRNRATFSIETVPFGLPGSPDMARFAHMPGDTNSDRPASNYWGNLNIGPAIGWTYSVGSQFRVSGPTTRIIVGFPLEDMEFSAYYRYLRYESDLTTHWRSAYGVRFDVGFSVLKGYVAVGSDHAYDQANSLRTSAMLSFGFELAGPISRIPLLNKL
jgi:hypothetical protein